MLQMLDISKHKQTAYYPAAAKMASRSLLNSNMRSNERGSAQLLVAFYVNFANEGMHLTSNETLIVMRYVATLCE